VRKRRKQERKYEARRERRASIVVDSAATSTVIRAEDMEHVELLPTRSTKVFYNANGTISKAGQKAKLHYNLRETARDADTVPSLALNSLLSTSKLADANYITIFTPDEVKVFDAEVSKLHITGEAVMKGWRCPKTKLWRVPLKEQWQNVNTDMALLSKTVTNIIMEKRNGSNDDEFINHVYELPNLEQVVAWYHAAAGYPTKATWLKAIEAGFYATWPLLTMKAVQKHFPESPKTSKGHMRQVKSGVRSTKAQVSIQRSKKHQQSLLNFEKSTKTFMLRSRKHPNWSILIKRENSLSPRARDTSMS
jgi:hypothetical protein